MPQNRYARCRVGTVPFWKMEPVGRMCFRAFLAAMMVAQCFLNLTQSLGTPSARSEPRLPLPKSGKSLAANTAADLCAFVWTLAENHHL